jgi:Zn-dependent protease with chaperone function
MSSGRCARCCVEWRAGTPHDCFRMTVSACLLFGSLVVALVAPRLLPPLTRSGRAPRLGAIVWALAIAGVAAPWLASPLLLLTDFLTPSTSLIRQGLTVAGGALGRRDDLGAHALLLSAAFILTARVAWRIGAGCRAARRLTRRHVEIARIAGRKLPGLDAYVLDSAQTAAYCLPGRARTIVLSTATLAALTPSQLAAVLAHERAHLGGHHHLLLRLSQGLSSALPRVRLFSVGAGEIAGLLEMWADDAAARRHGRVAVIGALAALAESHAPTEALAAGGRTAAARITRLLAPQDHVATLMIGLTLSATGIFLLLGPAATVLLATQGLSLCPVPSA